ncbi:MAG: exo-alpha-sialidase [Bacteroidales bacterium]|nr:exo-alpha-sialidase [Bacteroidales bacterium]
MATNKNRITVLLFAALALACCGEKVDTDGTPTDKKAVLLQSVWDMDTSSVSINSHAGDELSSVLQPIWSKFQNIPNAYMLPGLPATATDQAFSCYPRIKQMADGRFLMLYHGGQFGSRIWARTSSDFVKWTSAELLFEPVSVDIPEGDKTVQDWRRFVNPDAVVLKHSGSRNGEILMVCSYRATSHYGEGIDCGLSFRRSTNNGRSWSKAVNVPVGANWEPYLLELPDGTLHCYYTDATPQTRNSGTSLIVSTDGGQTWSEKIRVSRQYKYTYRTSIEEKKKYNGEKIYTDQMPCFRLLNDGKTLVGWLEARIENPAPPSDCGDSDTYKSHCEMSLVYNDGLSWKALGEESEGPERRLTNVMRKGNAGYISTFPSGEVFISSGLNNLFHIRLCDAGVTRFYGNNDWLDDANWYIPFQGKGYWGCTEPVGSNMLAVAMHKSPVEETKDPGCMQIGMYYLNQRQAPSEQEINIDGNASEWTADKGWFISSQSGTELFVRCALSGGKLCFALDRKEDAVSDASTVRILLAKDGTKNPLNVITGPGGLVSASINGATAQSRLAQTESGEKGYVSEISVPLASLGVETGDALRCLVILEEGNTRTMFSKADGGSPSTWQLIRL